MRVCFIVEDCYRDDSMPLDVARRMAKWGHKVDVLEPGRSIIRVSELMRESAYDAWVLKTVSGGPGLSLLHAAAAAGLLTINNADAIQCVRDKAVAAAIGRRHGLPFPLTYFAAVPELLREIPPEHFPLVVKPANGSSGCRVHLVRTPGDLATLGTKGVGAGFLLAQPYVVNPGADIKVYCADGKVYGTVQRSPLHPELPVRGQMVRLSTDLAQLAARIGRVFGLDLYGVDVVEGPDGWVVVDINDFPSYHWVPNRVARLARSIVRLASAERIITPARVLSTEEPASADGIEKRAT